MSEQSQLDLTLIVGANFEQSFILYEDPRVKQWRGEWQEYFVYEPGEAVELEPGEVFVALLRTMNVKPGGSGSEEFWSPAERRDLTGCQAELDCEDVFTLTESHGLAVDPAQGAITASASPVDFADPPTSARYYLKVTDRGGAVTFPRSGTMLFNEPGSGQSAGPVAAFGSLGATTAALDAEITRAEAAEAALGALITSDTPVTISVPVASSTWTLNHDLARLPASVTFYDTEDNQFGMAWQAMGINQIVAKSDAGPIAGTAVIY